MSNLAYVRLKSGTVIETENPEHWPEGERLTAKAGADVLVVEAFANLRKVLKPGDTVYTVLRHVSASGMSRRIDLYAIRKNQPVYLSGYAARILGRRIKERGEGITVGGCGMDMGFHLVYSLSRALFGPSMGAKRRKAAELAGKPVDPGYTLNHRWL